MTGNGLPAERVCEVAVPRPFLGTLAYAIPDDLVARVRPGVRVRVPLGKRGAVGVVDRIGFSETRTTAPTRLRSVADIIDDREVVGPAVLELCRWIADYYVAPLGVVLKTALPPGLLGGSGRPDTPTVKTQRVVRLTRILETLTEREEAFGRAVRQREAYEVVESLDGESTLSHLTGQLGFSRGVIEGLVARDLAMFDDVPVDRDPFAGPAEPSAALTPTGDQARVLAELRNLAAQKTGSVALLRGVTGSGKTLVYLDLLETVLASGKSAIVLVPEIALTPQTVSRFRARFGDEVAVLHSGLSDGERFDAWRALGDGRKRVAIGARSAVFAPVRNLGVIVVDEEHEGTYKQSDTPRYHARSVAIMRGRIEKCPCVLGSATPALESWDNARKGHYRLLELPERVTGHGLPAVELVDLKTAGEAGDRTDDLLSRTDTAPGERGPLIVSPRLQDAMAARLAREEQAILLLNRRGYATFVECLECGNVWSCENCSVTLTYHRRRRRLVCHHCGFEAAPPSKCGECGSSDPRFTGVGTEQVERRITELFPDARVARMDLDTTGSKWAHAEILDSFRARELDVLLGTQMIAKGLDFPGVTLVGVINADVGLHIPDFRASERTFQLLEQVAGRAGRGSTAGEVLVQTARPLHFALKHAAEHDYIGFADRELADREEPGYPPHRRLANLVISGTSEERVANEAESLADWTRGLIEDHDVEDVEVIGPAPCAIDRLRDRWRWHFLIKSRRPAPMGSVLRALAAHHGRADAALRVEIDRDPESLL